MGAYSSYTLTVIKCLCFTAVNIKQEDWSTQRTGGTEVIKIIEFMSHKRSEMYGSVNYSACKDKVKVLKGNGSNCHGGVD